MKRTSAPARTVLQSSQQFNSQLQMYSLAAGATGVGLLAMAQPAQGEIVYTPANVTITVRSLHNYPLDLNNDGTADFFIDATYRQSIDQSGGTSRIMVKPGAGNGAVGYGGKSALAMIAGQRIGSGRKFAGQRMATVFSFIGTEFRFSGQWANVKNRYLGLQFQIDGQTHYGWARLTVGGDILEGKLTGYAYETIPNTPIVAGKMSGTDSVSYLGLPLSERRANATLGALALGSPSLPFWRRDDCASEEVMGSCS
jgi:hypothetical protein